MCVLLPNYSGIEPALLAILCTSVRTITLIVVYHDLTAGDGSDLSVRLPGGKRRLVGCAYYNKTCRSNLFLPVLG